MTKNREDYIGKEVLECTKQSHCSEANIVIGGAKMTNQKLRGGMNNSYFTYVIKDQGPVEKLLGKRYVCICKQGDKILAKPCPTPVKEV